MDSLPEVAANREQRDSPDKGERSPHVGRVATSHVDFVERSFQNDYTLRMARPREFDEAEALERAMGVFWSQGYEATSVEDLVGSTGLNRGSLYAAFGDKNALFLRALEHYRCLRMEELGACLEGTGGARRLPGGDAGREGGLPPPLPLLRGAAGSRARPRVPAGQ
jgi:hypothetical protein